jgi:hypothetical protein
MRINNNSNSNNINSSSPENDHSNLMPMIENSNSTPQPSSSSSRTASKSRDGSRQRKFGKSILALSVFSSYSHSKLKKNVESLEASSMVQSLTKSTPDTTDPSISTNDVSLSMENSATVIGSTESPPKSTRNISLMLTKSSAHSKSTEVPSTTSNKKMIGSFEVDLEKLARELVLPSINAPLTSFNTNDEEVCSTTTNNNNNNNNNLIKPPLLSSKTIDTSNNLKFPNKAAMMQRSLTNNK